MLEVKKTQDMTSSQMLKYRQQWLGTLRDADMTTGVAPWLGWDTAVQ